MQYINWFLKLMRYRSNLRYVFSYLLRSKLYGVFSQKVPPKSYTLQYHKHPICLLDRRHYWNLQQDKVFIFPQHCTFLLSAVSYNFGLRHIIIHCGKLTPSSPSKEVALYGQMCLRFCTIRDNNTCYYTRGMMISYTLRVSVFFETSYFVIV